MAGTKEDKKTKTKTKIEVRGDNIMVREPNHKNVEDVSAWEIMVSGTPTKYALMCEETANNSKTTILPRRTKRQERFMGDM